MLNLCHPIQCLLFLISMDKCKKYISGNAETKPAAECYQLLDTVHKHVRDKPELAVACQLTDVKPTKGKWSDEANELLREKINEEDEIEVGFYLLAAFGSSLVRNLRNFYVSQF